VEYHNASQDPMYGNGSDWDNPPTAVTLGHELTHASHLTHGDGENIGAGGPVPNDSSSGLAVGRAEEERRTVGLGPDPDHGMNSDYTGEPYSENSIRRDLGEPERTSYLNPDTDIDPSSPGTQTW
jgi:hypothetical protein